MDSLVEMAAGNHGPIGAKDNQVDPVRMSIQRVVWLATTRTPQTHCLIKTGAGKSLTRGAKDERPQFACMAIELLAELARLHIPQTDQTVPTADQCVTVAMKGQCKIAIHRPAKQVKSLTN